ncbi:MAG: Unknown protein [uncultured Sulfurovum sp.]|uniref:Uncharacterized protein n=1 Tax=uncultured Sulfurovum sp. TaxID=269237 RepID=A0A6S6SIX7_9BACT|nr:MAG: Unknown protein [uncultured Sulfurovum sp.]
MTLENIKSISHDVLADLVYTQIDSNNILYEKVEKILLKNDPEALLKSIKKDIASIRRGRKFINYYESFEFAEKIASIVEDIELMVEDEKMASRLFKELIFTDSKVYLRSDDSAGSIQVSYASAEEGWNSCLGVLSDDEVYADIMEMLVCDGFGVRSLFSEKVPHAVLQRIYDEFYLKCEKRQDKNDDSFDDIHVLELCAHYLKKPALYIKSFQFHGREIEERDLLNFAKEYKYANDAASVVDMLNSIKMVDRYKAQDFYELQVWAYEKLNQPMNVTLAYKNWYDKTKSPEVLKKYLSRFEGVMQQQVKEEALKDVENLSFSEEIHFFHSLDEPELAAKYIWEHQGSLETQYIYANELRKIVNWLKKEYPQEAILIYRDSCEKALETSQSKNYPSVIRVLKECLKIEKANDDTTSWEIEENMFYMERLINTHKRKAKFVELFFKAFGEL